MKELTKKQKVFVLKEMIRYYENVKDNMCYAMCSLIVGICIEDFKAIGFNRYMIPVVFREFESYKPYIMHGVLWFGGRDYKSRIKYCKKILKLIESK